MKLSRILLPPLFMLVMVATVADAADALLRPSARGAGAYGLRVRLLAEPGVESKDGFGAPSARMASSMRMMESPSLRAADSRSCAAYVDYRWERWTVSGGMRQNSELAMRSFNLGASYGFILAPRHALALSGMLNVGNQAASALRQTYGGPVPAAGSGLRDIGGRLSLTYTFDRSWYVQTTLGYTRLVGDPAEAILPDRSITTFGASVGLPF